MIHCAWSPEGDGRMMKTRWYDGENTMVRWWKRDGTMVKTRWYDDENTMVRWWKRDGTMVKTRWYDGENTMVRWWKHDGTMMKSRWWIILMYYTVMLCHVLNLVASFKMYLQKVDSLRMATGRRRHDDENAMVRWWKRDGTMVKTRCRPLSWVQIVWTNALDVNVTISK